MFFHISFNVNFYLLLNVKGQNVNMFSNLIIEKVLVRAMNCMSLEMQPTAE